MFIHFDSKVGEFTMAGEPALTLIRMTGHSGTVPGAILAADIPAALVSLKAALENLPPPAPPRDEDDERERVPLGRRAFALVELLENAARSNADVMWDKL
jgi:hypothetical protein